MEAPLTSGTVTSRARTATWTATAAQTRNVAARALPITTSLPRVLTRRRRAMRDRSLYYMDLPGASGPPARSRTTPK